MENKKKNRIIETYKYQSLLGEGSYGKVYLVRANISKKYYEELKEEIKKL